MSQVTTVVLAWWEDGTQRKNEAKDMCLINMLYRKCISWKLTWYYMESCASHVCHVKDYLIKLILRAGNSYMTVDFWTMFHDDFFLIDNVQGALQPANF